MVCAGTIKPIAGLVICAGDWWSSLIQMNGKDTVM
jgi:hypothetical protein